MKVEAIIGLTGASLFTLDPSAVGFAPDAHLSTALAAFGLAGLLGLTIWSEQWQLERRKDVSRHPRDAHFGSKRESAPESPAARTLDVPGAPLWDSTAPVPQ